MSDTLLGAKVLITGGTGTFGSAFLEKCLKEGAKEVRIFSRDEKKQYDMAQKYRGQNVRFFLGDVRDRSTIDPAMRRVDFVFHAAAMKQVPSCESFAMEAVKTNILGSQNVIDSAIAHGVDKVVCLSTDKAVYPTSAMGMTKAYMEKLAMQKSQEMVGTRFCVTRFGNLVASRGSAVPLFIDQVKNGMPITITDPSMTRFLMTVADAVDLVGEAFAIGQNGEILVKKAAACTTGDLAKAVCKFMDLPEDYPVNIIGIRPGEKMHEALLTDEEMAYAQERGDYVIASRSFPGTGWISNTHKSECAPRMNENQVLDLIRSVYEGGTS